MARKATAPTAAVLAVAFSASKKPLTLNTVLSPWRGDSRERSNRGAVKAGLPPSCRTPTASAAAVQATITGAITSIRVRTASVLIPATAEPAGSNRPPAPASMLVSISLARSLTAVAPKAEIVTAPARRTAAPERSGERATWPRLRASWRRRGVGCSVRCSPCSATVDQGEGGAKGFPGSFQKPVADKRQGRCDHQHRHHDLQG